MNTELVNLLGELTPHGIGDTLVSEKLRVNCFPDMPLCFNLEDTKSDQALAEFVIAIKNFLELSNEDRMAATSWVFQNYSEFAADVGEDDLDFTVETPGEIWAHVHPSQIRVLRSYGDKKVYVVVEAGCDWEIEHGLQLVYREGKQLSRVSDQDGHIT